MVDQSLQTWMAGASLMKLHNNLIDKLKNFPASGPILLYLNCATCKYDFIGAKNQKRCAWCLARK